MKFDTPAGKNPIDQLKVIGKPADRIDGPLKTTGLAAYAYERHDVVANQAYGFVVGSAIAKGRVLNIDTRDAKNAAGVVAVLTTLDQPATPPTKSCAVRYKIVFTVPFPINFRDILAASLAV